MVLIAEQYGSNPLFNPCSHKIPFRGQKLLIGLRDKDPDNVALADGNGYFVCWAEFEDYLKVNSLMPEEVSI